MRLIKPIRKLPDETLDRLSLLAAEQVNVFKHDRNLDPPSRCNITHHEFILHEVISLPKDAH